MKYILIVDEDLGFVFWLGQILDSEGYVSIPARGVAEAAEIVTLLRLQIDALIASPAARGVRELIERLRFSSPALRVVQLANDEGTPSLQTADNVENPKLRQRDAASKSAWLEVIHGLSGNFLAPASP